MAIFRREPPPPLTGRRMQVGLAEIAILSLHLSLLASPRGVNAATGQVLSIRRRRTTVPQVVTLRW